MTDLRTLTVAEAALATGIPERTLRHLAKQRKITYQRAPRYRFRREDLEAYLASTRVEARREEAVVLASGYRPKHLK